MDPFGLDSSTERPRHLLMLLILSQLTERHFTWKAGSENWTQEDELCRELIRFLSVHLDCLSVNRTEKTEVA